MPDELPLEEVFEKFEDALRFLRARTPMPSAQFYALSDQARQKAFTVSNVAQMELVQQVLSSLDRAIDQGQDLESWRKEIGPALREAWAGDVENPAWRLETIFRTNLQTAFSHGRVRQMRDPAVTVLRPFRLFDATLDERTTDECSSRDGVLLPADDPWWSTNTPPLHFNCRSGIRSLRRAQADRRGGMHLPDREVELNPPGKGFGAAPSLDPDVQVTPYVPEVTAHPALEGARLRKERDFAEAEEKRRKLEAPHRPELWVAGFRAKGYSEEVAQRLAVGKATEERGLDRPVRELHAIAKRLDDAGLPIARGLREWLDTVVARGREETLRALSERSSWPERVRADVALLEHASSVAPRQSPLRMPGRPTSKYPVRQAAHDAAVCFYELLAHRDIVHPTDHTVRWGRKRGAYFEDKKRIGLSNQRGVFVHEWGHALEALNQALGRRSVEFLESRTVGERNRTGLEGYGKGEYGRPDKFFDPYVGRIYEHAGKLTATEVLSMGLQAIANGRSYLLIAEDPDLFWFCLGQLAAP